MKNQWPTENCCSFRQESIRSGTKSPFSPQTIGYISPNSSRGSVLSTANHFPNLSENIEDMDEVSNSEYK